MINEGWCGVFGVEEDVTPSHQIGQNLIISIFFFMSYIIHTQTLTYKLLAN